MQNDPEEAEQDAKSRFHLPPHLWDIVWFDDGDNEELAPSLNEDEQFFWISIAYIMKQYLDESDMNDLANALDLNPFRFTLSTRLAKERNLTSEAKRIFQFKTTINSILPKHSNPSSNPSSRRSSVAAHRSDDLFRLNTGSSVADPNSKALILSANSLPKSLSGSPLPPPQSKTGTVIATRSSSNLGRRGSTRRRSSVSRILSDGSPRAIVNVTHLPDSEALGRFECDDQLFDYVYSVWRLNPTITRPKGEHFLLNVDYDATKILPPPNDRPRNMRRYNTRTPPKEITYISPKTGERSDRTCTDKRFDFESEIFHNTNNFNRVVDWVFEFWDHFEREATTNNGLLPDDEIEAVLASSKTSQKVKRSRSSSFLRLNKRRQSSRQILKECLEKLILPGIHPLQTCVIAHGVYTTEKVCTLTELRENEPQKFDRLVEGGVVDLSKLDDRDEQSLSFMETHVWDTLDIWGFGLFEPDVWLVRLSASFGRVFQ